MAVANRASAIEGATIASEVFFCTAMAWKLFMMPQTVPKRPTKGEAVATMANAPRPFSMRALSRAMVASRWRSMRWISQAIWLSLVRPLARASRHSLSAPWSMRGSAWVGRSPASVATSSTSTSRPVDTAFRISGYFPRSI